eukprot:jgi/Ulvmu1/11553/UM078_0046.1
MAGVALARASVPLLLKEGGYGEDDIFNQDETGLLWRQPPTRTLASAKKSGRKAEKERVTISLTCNASGTEKRELFIIGKAKRPRSFPKKFHPKRDLGIRYANNKTAWMTTNEFSKWLLDWNSKLRGTGRKIALLTDNAPTHTIPNHDVEEEHGLNVVNLTNIKLIFLPPNITSHAQPLDQGIIAAKKAHYRRRLVAWLLEAANNPANAGKSLKQLRPNFYQMMRWAHSAWTEDITATTIRNCWRKAGILPEDWLSSPQAAAAAQQQQPVADTEQAQVLEANDAAQAQAELDDENLDNLLTELDADIHAAPPRVARSEQELPHAAALQQLTSALKQLAGGLRGDALDEGDELISASEYTNYDCCEGVFGGMSADEIVQVVMTQDTEQPDSDADEADNLKEPKLNASQALVCARDLHEYALAAPDAFAPADVKALDEIVTKMVHMSLQN